MTMKIMKPHANSAQQQDNAGHFSKTLHAAKAKNSQSIAATSLHSGKIIGGPIPKSSNSDDTVASTLQEICERLNNGGWISHDQLQEIASLINGLTPEQTQQVVEGLTDKELAALAKEMKAGGVGPLTGLTESERCDFIGMLASRLDAKQFQRVAEAFGDPATYAGVVAEQGSNDAKIGFINAFKEDASSKDPATAIGTVLASMDAEGLSRAIGHWDEMGNYQQDGAFSTEQLKTILEAGIEYLIYDHNNILHADPSTLNSILDAVADKGDVRMKAEVFSIASGILSDSPSSVVGYDYPQVTTQTAVSEHMNGILQSNPVGIIDYLEDTDKSGTALTNFVQQLWADGKTSELGSLVAFLASRVPGDPVSENAITNFSERVKDNASDLGYLLGAIRAGLNSLNVDKATEADQIKSLVAGIEAAAPYVGDLLGVLSNNVIDLVMKGLSNNDANALLNCLDGLPEDLSSIAQSSYSTVVVAQG